MKRPPESPRARAAIFAAYVALSLAYLGWRAGYAMNWLYPVYSVVFLAAETACILASFFFYAMIVRRSERDDPGPPPPGWSVDVLLATYNEDPALLRRSAVAARDMDYPHRTFLCDDGRRPAVEALAAELGIGYLTRSDNAHQKAGNLNHALSRTSGEFVLFLDADHVVRRRCLTRVLGHFKDADVALVQTPQVYYNIDSFQHYVSPLRRRYWHEAVLFHHMMQPGADRMNAAYFLGTGGVLRRAALESVGGIATGSVTEDVYTSMRLHARGWRSVFVDEPLGYMMAPDTPAAYMGQRLRWAQGSMQILRKENLATMPGLTLWQRVCYFNWLAGFLISYVYLLFYLAPGIYLFAGVSPVAGDLKVVAPVVAARIALALLTYKALAAPHARLFLAECFNMINAPVYIRASAALFSTREIPFRVTPKGSHGGLTGWIFLPLAFLFLLNLSAVGMGLLRLSAGDPHALPTLMSMLFAAYFSVGSALALLHVYERRIVSEAFAFPVSLPSAVRLRGGASVPARVGRLEFERAYVFCGRDFEPGECLLLDMSAIGGDAAVLADVLGSAASVDPELPNEFVLKLRLLSLAPEQRDAIDRYLFETGLPAFLSNFDEGPELGARPEQPLDLDSIRGFFHVRSEIM
ncbi:MAG: cellulose synthase catalytic subunit [Elusimicrobiota bacterium]